MKHLRRFGGGATLVAAAAAALLPLGLHAQPASGGVAVAIVFDTSGSMNDSVPNGAGQPESKAAIGKRALNAVLGRLDEYLTHASPDDPRRVDAALYAFREGKVSTAITMRPYMPHQGATWIAAVPGSAGGTPLGHALSAATAAVLQSPLARKHVLVITDGQNTVGPDPRSVLPGLKSNAAAHQTVVNYHFVAFDVDAAVFAPLKRLGSNVVGASNETQLGAQLTSILEKHILLEDEETPPATSR